MVECSALVQGIEANLAKTNGEAFLDNSAVCSVSRFSPGANLAAVHPPFCSVGSFLVLIVGNDWVDPKTGEILAVYNSGPGGIIRDFFARIFFWIGTAPSGNNLDRAF